MMKVSGTGLISAKVQQQFPQVSFSSVSKKPGGQTSLLAFAPQELVNTSSSAGRFEFKSALSDGFILDGYYLGTFEFDSLTGHPGIRY
ncbi:hypothetical protein [Rufibacter soli]